MKENGQKQFEKKLLFVYREKRQLKGRTFIGGFSVFKQLAVLSMTNLHTHGITFSDIFNFLVTRILICKILFFVM